MKTFLKLVLAIISVVMGIAQLSQNSDSKKNREKLEFEATYTEQESQLVTDQLMNYTWTGLFSVGEEQYYGEIKLNNQKDGTRRLYLTDDGKKGCWVEQNFKCTFIKPMSRYQDIHTIWLQFYDMNTFNCKGKLPSDNMEIAKQYKLDAKVNWYIKNVQIIGLNREDITLETPTNKKDINQPKVDIKQLKLLSKIEAELLSKIEGKPGGLKNPVFHISLDNHVVTMKAKWMKAKLGTIIFKDGKYIFKTDYWEKTNHYSSAAIWKNMTYMDAHGKAKTGDLEICYVANMGEGFWFKEIGY